MAYRKFCDRNIEMSKNNETFFIKNCLTHIISGRNEVVAKVIFLHLSVILFTGGVSASVHAGIPLPP